MWKKYLKNLNLPESYISITLGFLVVIVAGLLIYNNINRSRQGQVPTDEAAQTDQKVGLTTTTTHTVAVNETLGTIAEKYYGSKYNWVTIAEGNKLSNPDKIEVGQVLTIPKAEAIAPTGVLALSPTIEPTREVEPEKTVTPENTVKPETTLEPTKVEPTKSAEPTKAVESGKTYTVVKGDSLWKISVKELGDGYAWTKLAQLNNLKNPDIIHPGNVLKLP